MKTTKRRNADVVSSVAAAIRRKRHMNMYIVNMMKMRIRMTAGLAGDAAGREGRHAGWCGRLWFPSSYCFCTFSLFDWLVGWNEGMTLVLSIGIPVRLLLETAGADRWTAADCLSFQSIAGGKRDEMNSCLGTDRMGDEARIELSRTRANTTRFV
jgi:hypothetical protein